LDERAGKVVFSFARRGSANWAKTPDFVTGLVGGGLGSGWVDFDAALEVGAVFDADSSTAKVTGDRAVFRNFDATPSMDIADKLATDNHFAGVNFRMELRCGADDKVMTIEGDRTFHDAVDLQIFRAGDFSFDLQAGTQSRGRAGRRNC
jgi:hypothetical protein